MKHLKRILIWCGISLVLQISALFYVNNYLLTGNTSIKSKKITQSDSKNFNKVKVKIPEEAKDFQVSYDGKYISYINFDKLVIIDTRDGKEKQFKKDIDMLYCKWLPDRDRMLIAQKIIKNGEDKVGLSYYDAKKEEQEDAKVITYMDRRTKVEDIIVSTLNNVIYLKVLRGGNRTNIYRVDIMKEINKVQTRDHFVGKMAIIPHEDKLVYEGLINKNINITHSRQKLIPTGVTNPSTLKLIGVDRNDRVYIAQTFDDTVKAIYSTNLEEDNGMWKKYNIQEQDKNVQDILLTYDGKLYLNNNLKGMVKNLESGKETTYNGIFKGIYSKGIVSMNDGYIENTILD